LPRAGIERIDRELRRHQHGVEARLRHLLRHLLAPPHIALQRRLVAVEVGDDQARPSRIEALGNEQQRAAIAVGGVLPIDGTAARGVAAPPVLLHIQERFVASGRLSLVGEGRGLEGNELELCAPCRRRRRWFLHARRYAHDRRQHDRKGEPAT
jgi:hypothetical protein